MIPRQLTTSCAGESRTQPPRNRSAMPAVCLFHTRVGQVVVIDPDTGRNLLEPFQPIVEAGRAVSWTAPVVYGDKQVLISDGDAKLYRLAAVDAPARI